MDGQRAVSIDTASLKQVRKKKEPTNEFQNSFHVFFEIHYKCSLRNIYFYSVFIAAMKILFLSIRILSLFRYQESSSTYITMLTGFYLANVN